MKNSSYSHLKIQILEGEYKYVLFENISQFAQSYEILKSKSDIFNVFILPNEISAICSTQLDLPCVKSQPGWTVFKIVGEMPFGSVQGLISVISSTLYRERIGICVVSTYLTDLFLIRSENVGLAKGSLIESGWEFHE